MGIVGVSKKKPYVIVMWSLVGLGALFFLFGGIFSLSGIGATRTMPSGIRITASGITFDENAAPPRYNLNVNRKHTQIMINALPLGASSRVTFSLDVPDCLTITDRNGRDLAATNRHGDPINSISPGDSVTLTLIGGGDVQYKFGRTVRIQVSSGYQSVFLYVHIEFPRDQVEFDFSIGHSIFSDTFYWIPARPYMDQVYINHNNQINPSDAIPENISGSPYLFNASLNVLGAAFNGAKFSESPIDGIDHGIRLFGTQFDNGRSFNNIYIPIEVLRSVGAGSSRTFRFKITADLTATNFGIHIDYFDLVIYHSA